jgi:uncharacterized protein YndB with AHSA1/START domain
MNGAKTIEVRVERTIPAAAGDVFDAWLNPKVPGNPWHMADKYLLNPTVDGFFYWTIKGTPHYGRFTAVERPGRLEHTWMSPNTSGLESMVTVTFKGKGQRHLDDAGALRASRYGWRQIPRKRGGTSFWMAFRASWRNPARDSNHEIHVDLTPHQRRRHSRERTRAEPAEDG